MSKWRYFHVKFSYCILCLLGEYFEKLYWVGGGGGGGGIELGMDGVKDVE